MGKKVDFLIIGFTGPIGSGCTTLSKIISRLKPNMLIKKKKMSDEVLNNIKETSITMKNTKDATKLNELNKELHDYFRNRSYLKEIEKYDDPNFNYISMSSIIAKLSLKYLNTNEYFEWKKDNLDIANILELFESKWKQELDQFDNIKNTQFNILDEKELKQIDDMFLELNLMKEEIKSKELMQYFDEKIQEFHLQAFGDNLRRSGNPFNYNEAISKEKVGKNVLEISYEVNKIIKFYRNRKDDKKSCCFIIDAFRNPIEIEYFRKRYSQFYLVSVYADYKIRYNRLKKIFSEIDSERFEKLFKKLDHRDMGVNGSVTVPFIQNVSRCCYLSDIAVNNEYDSGDFDELLFEKFLKYYALMIYPGCIQPTKEETYMNLAYTLSLRSTCISRKVGAVITDKDDFILGLGWNDVAHSQIGCGLRLKQDLVKYGNEIYSMNLFRNEINEGDLSHLKDNDTFCFKDVLSQSKIKTKLSESKLSLEQQNEVLNLIKIKRLEYCRSLHAEENALLQVASRGGRGANGGTIYTTTFPCELCGKKIYQAGISKIFYTEPYPNSISENVFLKDGTEEISIKQFEGIKSFSYFKLYKPHLDRKEAQALDDNYYSLF